MKFFIGRLAITEGNSGTQHMDQALFVAKDEAQAKSLNASRAMMWGGDDGQAIGSSGWRFHDAETGTFRVYTHAVLEISATAFDDLKDWFPVFGDRKAAEAEQQEPAEAVKTLARRIGDQLVKHDAKVSHSKLLHAVAASIGKTNWHVASSKEASVMPEDTASLPSFVRVETKQLGPDRFQVDGFVNEVRVIEIDNRLDADKWYLGHAGTLPWDHRDAVKNLACVNAVFAQVKKLSKGPNDPAGSTPPVAAGAAGNPWFPSGNWPTTKLEDIRTFDFAARVNAIWLTHGDVKLAAKLLHVDPEALMDSFVDPMEADTAFCGRPVGWTAPNSLAPNLGMFAMQGHSNGFRTDRGLSLSYTSFHVTGYLGKTQMFRVSNAKDKSNPVFDWKADALPTNMRDVSLLAECLNEALRQSYEEIRVDWTPPKH